MGVGEYMVYNNTNLIKYLQQLNAEIINTLTFNRLFFLKITNIYRVAAALITPIYLICWHLQLHYHSEKKALVLLL